jgi:2-polyprenyl-6-methoxyphenol hydroxylase-like FAD-dependent oxidoreductase
MEKTHTKTVAVVGTGMAGLATAHLLHQDPQKRYQVTLIEKVGPFGDFMSPNLNC